MERGHPVRLSAKREQPVNEDPTLLSLLRTQADRDVRLHPLPVLTSSSNYSTTPRRFTLTQTLGFAHHRPLY
jgi:hypothetical protein